MHHRPARRRARAGATAALLLAATAHLPAALAAQQAPAWYETDRGRRITDEGPKPGIAAHIALYPVNRVADILDIFSFQFGLGFGVHTNAHTTRALQAGIGATAVSRLGFDRRAFGVCNDVKAEFSLLMFSAEYFKRQNAFGGFADYNPSRDLPWLYIRHRDYLGIGGEFTAGIVGISTEAHIGEVPDAILGFLGIDYMRDDWPRRPLARGPAHLRTADAANIRRVVIVSSRVVAERSTLMERAHGLGVYYHRAAGMRFFGCLGAVGGTGADRRAEREFNGYLDRRKFSIHRELLEHAHRTLTVRRRWDVVGIDDTLEAFGKHAVRKAYKGQHVRRLPNYRGLARHYGADAVLDVRVWEWGIWRFRVGNVGAMRLDCEYKLITQPENRVLVDIRFVTEARQKRGMSLLHFSRNDGEALVTESKEAAEIVGAKFADLIAETE